MLGLLRSCYYCFLHAFFLPAIVLLWVFFAHATSAEPLCMHCPSPCLQALVLHLRALCMLKPPPPRLLSPALATQQSVQTCLLTSPTQHSSGTSVAVLPSGGLVVLLPPQRATGTADNLCLCGLCLLSLHSIACHTHTKPAPATTLDFHVMSKWLRCKS